MTAIKAKVVLTDIEGTTTSISFVKDVLFPYTKKHCYDHLQQHWLDTGTQAIVDELCALPEYQIFNVSLCNSQQKSVDGIAKFVNYLIDEDVKSGPLKRLQGHILGGAYLRNNIEGHVYPDVAAAFRQWHQSNIVIAIYSSGSVKAQKLLFAHTAYGNLQSYISKYFDTTVGPKQSRESYCNIAAAFNVPAKEILFLTDIVKEAEAARAAGMQTIILKRPGNAELSDQELHMFMVVQNFDSFKLEKC